MKKTTYPKITMENKKASVIPAPSVFSSSRWYKDSGIKSNNAVARIEPVANATRINRMLSRVFSFKEIITTPVKLKHPIKNIIKNPNNGSIIS